MYCLLYFNPIDRDHVFNAYTVKNTLYFNNKNHNTIDISDSKETARTTIGKGDKKMRKEGYTLHLAGV